MNAKKTTGKTQVARKAPAKRAAARDKPGATHIGSVDDLMAYAYALEAEASDRYSEFSDAMEAHNNREVAELFRKLARIEHRHAEQILEEMKWVSPPPPPHGGYRWEGPEGPESGDITDLHYLMQPYHVLQIALHNEKRAEKFYGDLAKKAPIALVRKAARQMQEEEAEHVRLIEQWLQRTPLPQSDWAHDPDPPVLSD